MLLCLTDQRYYLCVMCVCIWTLWEIIIYMNKDREGGFLSFLKMQPLKLLSALLFQLRASCRKWIHWKALMDFLLGLEPFKSVWKMPWRNVSAWSSPKSETRDTSHSHVKTAYYICSGEKEDVTYTALQEMKFILINGNLKNQAQKTLIS